MNQLIELPVNEFKTALTGLAKVINGRSSLPVLGCLRLEPHPDGTLALQATDLDSFVTCRIKVTTMTEFSACITPIEPIIKILKGMKDRIWLVDGEKGLCLRYQVGSAAILYPLDMIPLDQWPALPEIKAKPFTVEPVFKQALREAMECSSNESTRYILNGACLDVSQADCHCLVATDGRHLYAANTFKFPTPDSVIIPNRKFLSWSGLHEDGNWSVAIEPPVMKNKEVVTPSHIQIQSDRWTFLTKGIEGVYPNWRQVVPSLEPKTTNIHLPEDAVKQILDTLPRMPGADDPNQTVTLRVESGQLTLSSRPRNSDQSTIVGVPGITLQGTDQQVALNRTFLSKALRFGFRDIRILDSLSPLVFIGPGKKMVAMPLRMESEPPPAPSAPPASGAAPGEAQNEATPPANPPAAPDQNTSVNETHSMNTPQILAPPERGNIKPKTETSNGTAMKAALDHIEAIKATLKQAVSDLSTATALLKAAEKEKRVSEKEIEAIRAKLRSLQDVQF